MYESTFWTPFGFLKTYLLVAWILSDCFEPSVFSSQQYLNRPAINAVQWRHHYPKTGQWFWLVDCLNICIIMYNYGKFLQEFCLIFSGLHRWHACMEFKHLDNLYCKPQNCPCLQNWIAKLNCKWRIIVGIESVGFSFSATLWFHSDFLYVKFLRPICHIVIQPSCYSPSSVMILLAFLSCFLVFFFLR